MSRAQLHELQNTFFRHLQVHFGGFKAVIESADLRILPNLTVNNEPTSKGGELAAQELLAQKGRGVSRSNHPCKLAVSLNACAFLRPIRPL
jgi:DNA-binding LacI/PurR family transcriptional regulator